MVLTAEKRSVMQIDPAFASHQLTQVKTRNNAIPGYLQDMST